MVTKRAGRNAPRASSACHDERMSTPADAAASRQAATAAASRRLSVETTGIEIIDESERTARPRDLFWPWFAANVSVFGMATASFVLGFGISFAQALAVCVVCLLYTSPSPRD